MPLSGGPSLILASAPTSWQGRHLANDCSPAATSCASAAPVEATITSPAITQLLITVSSRSSRFDLVPQVPTVWADLDLDRMTPLAASVNGGKRPAATLYLAC